MSNTVYSIQELIKGKWFLLEPEYKTFEDAQKAFIMNYGNINHRIVKHESINESKEMAE